MYRIIFSFLAVLTLSGIGSSGSFPTNGVKNTFEPIHALQMRTLFWAPGQILSNATLLIQGDRILFVDSTSPIPVHAIIHEMDGDYIYPSFIELHSEYGIPKKRKSKMESSTTI